MFVDYSSDEARDAAWLDSKMERWMDGACMMSARRRKEGSGEALS